MKKKGELGGTHLYEVSLLRSILKLISVLFPYHPHRVFDSAVRVRREPYYKQPMGETRFMLSVSISRVWLAS